MITTQEYDKYMTEIDTLIGRDLTDEELKRLREISDCVEEYEETTYDMR